MFLKILEMKFKAFILTAVSFCCLMVLVYIKVTHKYGHYLTLYSRVPFPGC